MTLKEIDLATRSALTPMRTVQEIFGTSLSGAYGLAARGQLQTIKFGRRRLAKTAPIREQFGLPPITPDQSSEAA